MQLSVPRDNAELQCVFLDEIDGLYRYALGLIGNRTDAEDALQDAFVRVAKAANSSKPVAQPRAWLFRVVRNTCIDRLRASKRRRQIFADDADAQTDALYQQTVATPESKLLIADALQRVDAAIQGLPKEQAQTLSLIVVEGLSYQDVAEITGTTVAGVRSRLFRARQYLRTVLNSDLTATSNVVELDRRSGVK